MRGAAVLLGKGDGDCSSKAVWWWKEILKKSGQFWIPVHMMSGTWGKDDVVHAHVLKDMHMYTTYILMDGYRGYRNRTFTDRHFLWYSPISSPFILWRPQYTQYIINRQPWLWLMHANPIKTSMRLKLQQLQGCEPSLENYNVLLGMKTVLSVEMMITATETVSISSQCVMSKCPTVWPHYLFIHCMLLLVSFRNKIAWKIIKIIQELDLFSSIFLYCWNSFCILPLIFCKTTIQNRKHSCSRLPASVCEPYHFSDEY